MMFDAAPSNGLPARSGQRTRIKWSQLMTPKADERWTNNYRCIVTCDLCRTSFKVDHTDIDIVFCFAWPQQHHLTGRHLAEWLCFHSEHMWRSLMDASRDNFNLTQYQLAYLPVHYKVASTRDDLRSSLLDQVMGNIIILPGGQLRAFPLVLFGPICSNSDTLWWLCANNQVQ